jgi:hypothetical protein
MHFFRHACAILRAALHKKSPLLRSGPLKASKISIGSCCFVRFSVFFVDRVLSIRGHAIHEVTLSNMKEHEIRVFVQSSSGPIGKLSSILFPSTFAALVPCAMIQDGNAARVSFDSWKANWPNIL